MPPSRFRIRTIMLLVAALSLVLGTLRFILWFDSVLGINLLIFVAYHFAVFVLLPILVIVELLFFAIFLWIRRKRSGADGEHG